MDTATTSQARARLMTVTDSLFHWRETARPKTQEDWYRFENGWANSSLRRRLRGEDESPSRIRARTSQPVAEALPLLHCVPSLDKDVQLYGHALVFDKYSRDRGGFVEKIAKGANVRWGRDVTIRLSHNETTDFGSLKEGSLRLSLDVTGLAFCVTQRRWQPLFDLAAFLIERRGWVQCSMGYFITHDSWKLAQSPEQIDLRIITGLEVIEVSLLDYAAWPDTRVAVLRPTARPKPARVHQTESFDFDVEQAICAFFRPIRGEREISVADREYGRWMLSQGG